MLGAVCLLIVVDVLFKEKVHGQKSVGTRPVAFHLQIETADFVPHCCITIVIRFPLVLCSSINSTDTEHYFFSNFMQ